jgi:hypothetical protein
MARIQGVSTQEASPMTRLVYRFMRRGMTKLTGRQAARGSGIEPVELWGPPAEDDERHGQVPGGGAEGP